METTTASLQQLLATAKRLMRRLLIMGENRLEILTVEVQEERERLLHAFLLALGVATFGLLAGIALTAAVVVIFWTYSPVIALLTLTVLYGATAVWLGRRLMEKLRDWRSFSTTLDQLRKDRACLEKKLT